MRRQNLSDQNSQNGFSIVETLVGVGILSIGFFAAVSMSAYQAQEANRLSTKSELGDLREEVRRAMLDRDTCTENFGSVLVNDSQVGTVGYSETVNELVELGAGGAPTPLFASTSSFVPANSIRRISGEVYVNEIRLINWKRGSATNRYSFDIEVRLWSPMGPFAPLKILGVTAQTDPAAAGPLKAIQTCKTLGKSYSTASPAAPKDCRKLEYRGGTALTQIFCDPGEKVLSGGGVCGKGSYSLPNFFIRDDAYWMHQSEMTIDGSGRQGWQVDCWNKEMPGYPENTAFAKIFAICCK